MKTQGTIGFTPKTKIESCTRDQLALELFKLMNKRKMAEKYSARFRSHPRLGPIFNVDDVQGNINKTLTYVINAWEVYTKNKLEKRKKLYQRKKNRKKVIEINKMLKKLDPPQDINLASSTKLNTFGELTGYFVNAVKNNLHKMYKKYTTETRKATDIICLDGFTEEHERNALDALVSIDPQRERDYEESIAILINFLEKEDQEENSKILEKYGEIPLLKESKMASLFKALLDPEYKGNLEQLQEDFGWSDYIFKKQKERMALKLRKEYMKEGMDLLNYVIEKNHRVEEVANKNRHKKPRKERGKPRKELDYQFSDTTCHTQVVFSQSKKGKKYEYTAKILLARKNPKGRIETIDEKKKSLVLKGGSLEDFSKAKAQLQEKIKKDLDKMKEKAADIQEKAKKYHYAS